MAHPRLTTNHFDSATLTTRPPLNEKATPPATMERTNELPQCLDAGHAEKRACVDAGAHQHQWARAIAVDVRANHEADEPTDGNRCRPAEGILGRGPAKVTRHGAQEDASDSCASTHRSELPDHRTCYDPPAPEDAATLPRRTQ